MFILTESAHCAFSIQKEIGTDEYIKQAQNVLLVPK